MTNAFLIHLERHEGALQRLIGLIERRGFQIDRMNVADAGVHQEVRLAVRGRDDSRCPDVLGRQIDRLIGVRRITPASSPHVGEAVSCPA